MISAAAYDLTVLDRFQVQADWFNDPQYRVMYLLEDAFRRAKPEATMVTGSELVRFAAATPGASQLIKANGEAGFVGQISGDEFHWATEDGMSVISGAASYASVLHDAASQVHITRRLADATTGTHDPRKMIEQIQQAIDEVAEPTTPEITVDTLPIDDDAPMPRPMGKAAFRGPAGEFVRLISSHTESSPEALLLHFFLYFSAMSGRFRFFLVDGSEHYIVLFVVFVGKSSKARKGTANANVERFFRLVDGEFGTFMSDNVVCGLSSGEGVIHHVRDATVKDGEVTDEGVSDKRLAVMEPEFAQVLKVGRREGNTLSIVIRCLWDSGRVRTLTRTSPLVATGAHVCIGGHIVREELRQSMSGSDQHNGTGNRFLWVATERSKLLPNGGNPPPGLFAGLVGTVRSAIAFAQQPGQMKRTPAAELLWARMYASLAADRSGIVGAITNRCEAQILRLSMIYALLECSNEIDVPHLQAAMEVWRYCEESVEYAFGSSTGDKTADSIRAMLRTAGDAGMSRTDISKAFQRNKSSEDIRQALGLLQRNGMAHARSEKGSSRRPTERWFVGVTNYEFNESDELDEFNPPVESSSNSLSSCNSLVRTTDERTDGYVERVPEQRDLTDAEVARLEAF